MDQRLIKIEFSINGRRVAVDIATEMTALQVLREVLELTGTKEGCGIGECGACTIVVDGDAVNACLLPGVQLDGREVLTVEGLEKDGKLHVLQERFISDHAVQCGFCTPGILMSTHALLNKNSSPNRAEIAKAIAGNLCRCTGYQQIITSIENAVDNLARLEGVE